MSANKHSFDDDLFTVLEAHVAVQTAAVAALELVAGEGPRTKKPRKKRSSVDRALRGDPATAPWQLRYVNEPANGPHPCDDERLPPGKKFRRNFRVPRSTWKYLVERAQAENWAPHVGQPDAVGHRGASLGLLVLAALSVLGRGVPFEMLEDLTHVAGQTIRKFCLLFVARCSATLFPEQVRMPTSQEEYTAMFGEFEAAGYHGALGCMDAVQIQEWMCAYNQRHTRTGKEGYPTRGFNALVTFRRRLVSLSPGYPGSFNDKTKAHLDPIVEQVRSGVIAFPWTLYNSDGGTEVRHRNYFITDNGYLQDPVFLMPQKYPRTVPDARMSKNIESVRKCVECFFGILQCRFTILRCFRMHDESVLDDVFRTCCALHNMLLEHDGLDVPYTGDADYARDVEQLISSFDATAGDGVAAGASDADDSASDAELDQWVQEHEGELEPIVGYAAAVATAPAAAATATVDEPLAGPVPTTLPHPPAGNGATSGHDSAGQVPQETYAQFFKKMSVHWDWLNRQHRTAWPSRG